MMRQGDESGSGLANHKTVPERLALRGSGRKGRDKQLFTVNLPLHTPMLWICLKTLLNLEQL